MHVDVEIPDGLFRGQKTEREIAAELREAAAIYWLARGEIDAPAAERVVAAGRRFKDFKEALLAIPNVGLDEDFARDTEAPRDDEDE